jgi:DNA-binding response OmpR family regulator
MNKKILVVEDSKEVHRQIEISLGILATLEFQVNLSDAQASLDNEKPDLIILDIELPDGSGIDLCSKIQMDNPEIPIFLLTGKEALSEKIMGFSAGADDYITKPFESLELKARVEAKLRKMDLLEVKSDFMEWEEISINIKSQEVILKQEQPPRDVELTSLEFKLLLFFADNANDVLSRDVILNEIWGKDVHVYSRSVDTHVSKLRKKLEPFSELIQSVHGSGYKFAPQ